jgi:type III pantothenate kinase
MLLAIDVGNTNVTIGVFDGERLALASRRCASAPTSSASSSRTCSSRPVPISAVQHRGGLGRAPIMPVEEMSERYFSHRALVVDATNAGMPVRYVPPGDVGADRIVNAVAAWAKYGKAGSVPLIVVDFGTGTTFDIISTAGEYLGGVICPGIGISAEALFQRAARLPRVDVRKPATVIGQNTVNAMQSGLFFGYVEMVDGLVRRIRAELEGGDKAVVIATGGLADVISGESAAIQYVDPNLTLDGLRLIWERLTAKD